MPEIRDRPNAATWPPGGTNRQMAGHGTPNVANALVLPVFALETKALVTTEGLEPTEHGSAGNDKSTPPYGRGAAPPRVPLEATGRVG